MVHASPQKEMKEEQTDKRWAKQTNSRELYIYIHRVKGMATVRRKYQSSKVHDGLSSQKGKLQITPKEASRSNYGKKEKKTTNPLPFCPLIQIQDLVSAAFVSPSLQSALSPPPPSTTSLGIQDQCKNKYSCKGFLLSGCLFEGFTCHMHCIVGWRDAASRRSGRRSR